MVPLSAVVRLGGVVKTNVMNNYIRELKCSVSVKKHVPSPNDFNNLRGVTVAH